MSINIWTDSMQHAALLGKPVLFTNWLIQRDIIPDGWYCYDLRGTHKSPSTRTTLVDHAADYHAGTVLSPIPLKHEGTASRRVNGTFYLLGEEMTLEQFCEEHDLAYPQDNREFVLRPASLDEVGLFYSEEKLDEALGTVGHLRMDFGHGEKEFWHTWWPHNEDRFNTPEFKEVLQRFVDDLRQTGLLKNLGAMDAYAEMMFREKYSALPEELFQTPQAAQIGQKMLDDRLGVITEYGLIRRKDGQPLPVFQPEQEIGQGLEMM